MVIVALGRASVSVLGSVRFFFEMNANKHCWISQRELGNRQADQINLGMPMMNATTATVKNMPMIGRDFSVSVWPGVPSSVLHANEEQACANYEIVCASKQPCQSSNFF